MARMTDPWSARQQRHLAYISEFSTDIQHVAGKNNAVADTLSRTVQAIGAEGIDYAAMAIDQQSDNDLQNLRTTSTGLRLKKILFDSATTIWCDVSTGTLRPVVPPGWRRSVFDVVHNLSHPGVQTTRTMVANKFMWRNMNKQVTEWPGRAFLASNRRSLATCAPRCNVSRCRSAVSTPSTSISSDRCRRLRVFRTCSPSWTGSRGGQKPSLSRTPRPSLAPGRCCFIGSHVSAFRRISLRIEEPSSHLNCGLR